MPFATKSYDAWAPYTQAFVLGGGTDGTQILYGARAAIGTAKTEAKWQIYKLTYSGDSVTDIQWAGYSGRRSTDNFDKVFNDYASYTYA